MISTLPLLSITAIFEWPDLEKYEAIEKSFAQSIVETVNYLKLVICTLMLGTTVFPSKT